MRIAKLKQILNSILVLLLVSPAIVWAIPKQMRNQMTQYAQGESRTDKSQAADIARSAHGGKVLNVEEVSSGGRTVYRVKLLLDGGRIKIVTVDGTNGRII